LPVIFKHLRNFCINKNKMVIIREDQMLMKVLHQEKGYGSKKLLAEFSHKAFELIPAVFMLESCVFSVLKAKKYHNTVNALIDIYTQWRL